MASSIQKVRQGEAAFERDGVAFQREEYDYGVVCALLYIAAHEGRLNMLDFGGSLGSTYFQNRKLLTGLPLEWHVVEQKIFVRYGKKNVPEVEFHEKAEECIGKGINCVLISSSLQYVDEPYRYLDTLLSMQAKYLILARMPFGFEKRNRIVLEYVPESIYKAVYPAWLLDGKQVLDEIGQCYMPIFPLPNLIDRLPLVEGQTARIVPYYGWLFVRK